jgi:hypothetical protein
MPRIWIMPVGVDKYGAEHKDRREELDGKLVHCWSVPPGNKKGDLILFYYTAIKKYPEPIKCIRSIYEITGEKEHKGKSDGWVKRETDTLREITRISEIEPITLKEIKQDESLKTALIVKLNFVRRNELELKHWKRLYNLIIQKNPGLEKELVKWDPKNKIY